MEKVEKKFDAFHNVLAKFNTKGTPSAAKQDVRSLIEGFKDDKRKNIAMEMFNLGHALMSCSVHFLCGNHMTTDLKDYALKSENREKKDESFKANPTPKELRKYWTNVRSLLDMLEDSEDDTEERAEEEEQEEPRRRRRSRR
ncbi:hypothetical protein QZH41_008026 [Actinostola sp. cb2023]|nr:hypothetical protein QZH41_008026 [Actinostola sp. cb2023]